MSASLSVSSNQMELPLRGRTTEAAVAQDRPLSIGIRDACRLTGISRSKLYLVIGEGELATFKIGSRTLIAWRDLEDFIARCRRA